MATYKVNYTGAQIDAALAKANTAVQPEAGKGLFSGNYNDLSNKPTIPTVSQSDQAQNNSSANDYIKNRTHSKSYIDKNIILNMSEAEESYEGTTEADVPYTEYIFSNIDTDLYEILLNDEYRDRGIPGKTIGFKINNETEEDISVQDYYSDEGYFNILVGDDFDNFNTQPEEYGIGYSIIIHENTIDICIYNSLLASSITFHITDDKYNKLNVNYLPIFKAVGEYNILGEGKIPIPQYLRDLIEDEDHHCVSGSNIDSWNGKEDPSNKVTSITSTSTDNQYPSAKCIYDNYKKVIVLTESEYNALTSYEDNTEYHIIAG